MREPAKQVKPSGAERFYSARPWASPLRGKLRLFKFVPDKLVVTLPKHNFAGSEIGRALARPQGEGQDGLSQKSPGGAGGGAPRE